MECKRAQNLIDPYFDQELDPLHAMEVEAHVQECERCAALLKARDTLRQALRTRLPYYPAPVSLRRKVAGNASRFWRPFALALAACIVLMVGAWSWTLLTPLGRHADSSNQLADAIESDHLRSLLNPDHLTDVLSSSKHTVKPWFAGKLPFSPPVNDLAAEGFPLLGGRLDVLDFHPIAALVYQRDKHIISLFIWPSDHTLVPPRAITTAHGYHIVCWTAEGMEFWAVSDVEAAQLAHFADLQRAASAPAH
jgi:anti-sigma factor RsiW